MDELISREAALYWAEGGCHPSRVAEKIRRLPSVQPEVVRCKDCMNYYWPENREQKEREWTCWKYGIPREPDDFCSNAKKKPAGKKEENE